MKKKPYIYKNKIPKSLKKKRKPRKRHSILQKMKKRDHLPRPARWPLPGLIGIGSLLLIILVIPTVIVIPFVKEDRSYSAVEADPAVNMDVEEEPLSVSVMRTSEDDTEEVPLETYVARVVASEMPTEFEMEALKAQGLAARTYIVSHMIHQDDVEVTDEIDHQVYQNEDELREQWGKEYHDNMTKLTEAVAATEGEILTYEGAPITAAYFSTGNGYTENSEDYWEHEIPYLRSVESPWDEDSPKFLDQQVFSINEVEAALDITVAATEKVDIELSETDSQRVDQMTIAGETFAGREIRDKLSLQSSDFSIEQNGDHLIFKTKGYGHGIGMSQYGANGMAEEGKTYEEIVHYYYQDIDISKITEVGEAEKLAAYQ